ncbi:hypothetical protein LCGC14_1804340 [marine sediment metagenome]|uniref:YopX protein domain-containing protein n=1 Tax=marine sediment metagenome TaxID=412755 RepID=A0A0F9GNR4_9ZZZZ
MSSPGKYRGWDTRQKVMYSAEEMGQDQLTLSVDGRGFINVSGRSTKLSTFCTHIIPMQYTGKHDNDGKDICAGDICRNGDWEEDAHAWNYRIEEVIWDSCNAGWLGWNDTERGCCCKVIGNIHQNPELLEGK